MTVRLRDTQDRIGNVAISMASSPYEIRNIPRAVDIDYNDTEEILAYSQLLARLLEWHGGLNTPRKNSPIVRALDTEGKYWLREVKLLLTDNLLSAIPDLLDAYIFFDSVCRGRRDTGFYKKVRLNVMKRWLRGDETLTETQIMCLLWPMVCSGPRNEDQCYAKYCSDCLDSWIKELRKFGRFNGISDTEAYQRLNYVLNKDLFAFIDGGKEVEKTTKINWAKVYLIEDISSLDTTVLRSYIPFTRTVSDLKQTPFEDCEAEYESLSEELASRPDLHPLYREAIRLGIANRKRLLADCADI